MDRKKLLSFNLPILLLYSIVAYLLADVWEPMVRLHFLIAVLHVAVLLMGSIIKVLQNDQAGKEWSFTTLVMLIVATILIVFNFICHIDYKGGVGFC